MGSSEYTLFLGQPYESDSTKSLNSFEKRQLVDEDLARKFEDVFNTALHKKFSNSDLQCQWSPACSPDVSNKKLTYHFAVKSESVEVINAIATIVRSWSSDNWVIELKCDKSLNLAFTVKNPTTKNVEPEKWLDIRDPKDPKGAFLNDPNFRPFISTQASSIPIYSHRRRPNIVRPSREKFFLENILTQHQKLVSQILNGQTGR